MAWREVDYFHLKQAMNLIDAIGLDAARDRCNQGIAKWGFRRARSVKLYDGKRGPYEWRVLVATAHALQFPDRPKLHPTDFNREHRDIHGSLEEFGPYFRNVGGDFSFDGRTYGTAGKWHERETRTL